MKRVFILMMDSFGVGALPDAKSFKDEGANTLGSIAEQCALGKADRKDQKGALNIPNLVSFGLGELAKHAGGKTPQGLEYNGEIKAKYGYAKELSNGKDTPSGHWEMAGVPVLFDWGYFKQDYPSFPEKLVEEFCKKAGIDGIIGNKASSGTVILDELGEEHIKTKKPICYTSADSVFQIAAHEKHFGLERLYELCHIARELCDEYNIGRVIARPFVGEKKGEFVRTANRHDYSVLPPAPTVLDKMKEAGGNVVSIGKISDIFAHQGITKQIKASGLEDIWNKTLQEAKNAPDKTIVFPNFVDFDMLYGHRRDVAGYAGGLEYFDKRLPELLEVLQEDDLVIITADHGCDPTFEGTDHTREYVPVIAFGKNIKPEFIGQRETFADIAQSIAEYFNLEKMEYGTSFL